MKILKATLIIYFIISCFLGHAQYKELNITPIGQKADLWCWAACMEMIHDNYQSGNGMTQCTVADLYLNRISNSITVPSNCSNCPLTGGLNYDVFMPYNSTLGNTTTFGASFFDITLSDLGYYSVEDINVLNWENYISEIDNCRPVIMMYLLLYNSTGRIIYGHAVLGKGYLTFFTNGQENSFLLINDPLEVCSNGRQYLLSKTVLTSTTGALDQAGKVVYDSIPDITVSSINSMVHHIYPKEYPCDTCAIGYTTDETSLSPEFGENLTALKDMVIKHKFDFIGTANEGVFSENYVRTFNRAFHFPTRVNYLSPSYFSSNPSKDAISTKKGFIGKNQLEVTFKRSEIPIAATIDCNESGSDCIVEKIAYHEEIPKEPIIIDNHAFYLNNDFNQQEGSDSISYSILRYLPYPVSFYQVEHKNKTYLVPKNEAAKNLFQTNTEIEGAILAIPEKRAIEGINIYTQLNPIEPNLKENNNNNNSNKLNQKYLKLIKVLDRCISSQKIFKQYVKFKN